MTLSDTHDSAWNHITLCYTPWLCLTSHNTAWNPLVLPDIPWHCLKLHDKTRHSMMSWKTPWYYQSVLYKSTNFPWYVQCYPSVCLCPHRVCHLLSLICHISSHHHYTVSKFSQCFISYQCFHLIIILTLWIIVHICMSTVLYCRRQYITVWNCMIQYSTENYIPTYVANLK